MPWTPSDDEWRRIVVDVLTQEGRRNRAMVLTAYDAALRRAEHLGILEPQPRTPLQRPCPCPDDVPQEWYAWGQAWYDTPGSALSRKAADNYLGLFVQMGHWLRRNHPDVVSPDLELPSWLVYACIPLGSYLMCFRFLQVCWNYWWTDELPHHDASHVDGVETSKTAPVAPWVAPSTAPVAPWVAPSTAPVAPDAVLPDAGSAVAGAGSVTPG